MDKAVDARDNLGKCTEVGDRDDLCIDNLAELIVGLEDVPRILGLLLVDKGDLAVFGVDILDGYFNVVADRDNVGRVLYSRPREVGLSYKAVDPADIDEYAVIGDRLDLAHYGRTDSRVLKECGALCGPLLGKNLSYRTDGTLALLVELDDFKVHGLF